MSADILNIRDYQKIKPLTDQRTTEQKSAEFMSDLRDKILYESGLGFVAEEKDPA